MNGDKNHRAIDLYLKGYIQSRLKPFWVRLDDQYVVQELAGDARGHGYADLKIGDDLEDRLDFLTGLDAASLPDPLTLPYMEDGAGKAAHIHVIALDGDLFVLFLDATQEYQETKEIQQVANESVIHAYHQNRILRELERAKTAAEEASRLKGRFIANMSHELRTPLSSIMGYAHLIKSGKARDEDTGEDLLPHHAEAIERGAQHLLSLIDNILDQARFEAGQLEVRAAPARLDNLLKDVESIFRPLTQDKGLAFAVEQQGHWPDKVEFDALRTRQIVINLISNAVKFTDQGSVTVSLDWRDEQFTLKVADTGPGIPPEAQKRVFEAYRREKTNVDQRAGAGLGLSISAVLAQRMGGALGLESEVGVGTTFSLSIPAPAVEAEQKPAQARQGARILVVEDDEDISALMEIFLQQAGMDVHLAEDGQKGLNMGLELKPDALFLDMHLPYLDGPEVSSRLRDKGFTAPIIAMSASSGGPDRHKAMQAGASDFLAKPVDPERMMELLAQWIPDE